MSSSNTAAPSLEGLVKSALHRSWWLLLLRGIAAVAFGVLTFVWPQISLLTLIMVYGVYALIDGVLALIAAIRGGGFVPRWWLALGGVVSILAAVVAFAWPGLTALVLVYLIGFWSILRGVLEIVGAIRLRNEIANEWTLGVAGALSVIFGLILVFMPGAGALGLLWLIAAWAVLFGLLLIWVAFKVRTLAKA
ncbi:HdeD family acid-resistance protein [Brevundimonas diminuta]|uniref:HdeD family acid-resistance protein n=1 Tax=Brevundimonas diminuta TaxID=293 RepID=UPI0022AF871A|nr:HdeD family acid-resistance protein [Brevundimonas diminuta]MCZ4108384.1 HdeD family acid-resistance protein [Brevundimonas diminuta]